MYTGKGESVHVLYLNEPFFNDNSYKTNQSIKSVAYGVCGGQLTSSRIDLKVWGIVNARAILSRATTTPDRVQQRNPQQPILSSSPVEQRRGSGR